MEQKPNVALLSRVALLLEREARLIGVDIEIEIAKILEKLRK